ncbi:MAG: hypothetical protein JXR33_00220 [Coriobacteriia bacterium]|nr:hypothetical protein [Coriobacteriia bacterium]
MTGEEVTTTFTEPTLDEVVQWIRELEYGQRFVGHAMTPTAGNSVKDIYSMRDLAIFVLGTSWDAPMLADGFKGALNWMDAAKLAAWVRETVGDVELADAIERETSGLETFRDQSMAIAELVKARMVQYDAVYRAAQAAKAAEAAADEAEASPVE